MDEKYWKIEIGVWGTQQDVEAIEEELEKLWDLYCDCRLPGNEDMECTSPITFMARRVDTDLDGD